MTRILEQIEAALLSDSVARRDEALDAAYIEIENFEVLLSEAKAVNAELRANWKASEAQVERLDQALRTMANHSQAKAGF